jgi:hypothetical protein
LDAYSESVDSLKITSYGLYMFNALAYDFTYLDIVCTDCGVFSEEVSNYLIEAARQEYALFTHRDRVARVKVRLDRVEHFIHYLQEEEQRERELYSLGIPDDNMFTYKSLAAFEAEKGRVLASAQRQRETQSGQSRRTQRG